MTESDAVADVVPPRLVAGTAPRIAEVLDGVVEVAEEELDLSEQVEGSLVVRCHLKPAPRQVQGGLEVAGVLLGEAVDDDGHRVG